MNQKTRIYFGPPLVALTEEEGNTLEVSGRINRTAERYLAMRRFHGVDLTAAERDCVRELCSVGFMSPEEIAELPGEVRHASLPDAVDREALAGKLDRATFADLVAMVEELGF